MKIICENVMLTGLQVCCIVKLKSKFIQLPRIIMPVHIEAYKCVINVDNH